MTNTLAATLQTIPNEQKLAMAYTIATVDNSNKTLMEALQFMKDADIQSLQAVLPSMIEVMATKTKDIQKEENTQEALATIQMLLRFIDNVSTLPTFLHIVTTHKDQQCIEKNFNALVKETYLATNAVCEEHQLHEVKAQLNLNFKVLSRALASVLYADTMKELEQFTKEETFEVATVQYRPRPAVSKFKKADWLEAMDDLNHYDYDTQMYLVEAFFKKYLNHDGYNYKMNHLKAIATKFVYQNKDLYDKINNARVEIVHLLTPTKLNTLYPFFPYKHQSTMEMVEEVLNDLEAIERPIERLFQQKRIFDTIDVVYDIKMPQNYKETFQPYLTFKAEFLTFIEAVNQATGLLNGNLYYVTEISQDVLETPIEFKGETILFEAIVDSTLYTSIKIPRYAMLEEVQNFKHKVCQMVRTPEKSKAVIVDDFLMKKARVESLEALKLAVVEFLKLHDAKAYEQALRNAPMTTGMLEWVKSRVGKFSNMHHPFYEDALKVQIANGQALEDIATIMHMESEKGLYDGIIKCLENTLTTHENGLALIKQDIEEHLLENPDKDVTTMMYTLIHQSKNVYGIKVALAAFAQVLPLQMKAFAHYYLDEFDGDLSDAKVVAMLSRLPKRHVDKEHAQYVSLYNAMRTWLSHVYREN